MRVKKLGKIVDVDYPYEGAVLTIHWDVVSPTRAQNEGRWPVWTKDEMQTDFKVVMPL